MVLVFIFTIIILIAIIFIFSSIKIEVKNMQIKNKKQTIKIGINKDYEIKILLKFLNKIPYFYIKLDSDKNKKIFKKFDFKKARKKFPKSKQLKKIIKTIEIEKLELIANIGTESAAATSILVGAFAGTLGATLPILARNNMNRCTYIISPVYADKYEYKINLDCIICIKIVHIIKSMLNKNERKRWSMSDHPIEGLMLTTMNSIKDMIDVNTIVGEPIETLNNITIIPISKVGFGFASGGSEFKGEVINEYSRKDKDEEVEYKLPFGGGSGAGVSISPVAFLVVEQGNVKLMPVNHSSALDRLLDYVPDLMEKVSKMLNKQMDNKNQIKEELKQKIEEARKYSASNDMKNVKIRPQKSTNSNTANENEEQLQKFDIDEE